jgi:putative transposase
MHRDLFSAFLSRHVNDEDNLLLHLARDEWGRLEPILTEAWEEFQKSANQVSASESGLCHSPLERISVEDRSISQIAIKGEKLI